MLPNMKDFLLTTAEEAGIEVPTTVEKAERMWDSLTKRRSASTCRSLRARTPADPLRYG